MRTEDLVQRLVDAAEEAIRNERPSLEHRPHELSSFVLDIDISNAGAASGAVLDARGHVTRRYVFKPDAATRRPMPCAAVG